jgi:uncharacterized protein YbcI
MPNSKLSEPELISEFQKNNEAIGRLIDVYTLWSRTPLKYKECEALIKKIRIEILEDDIESQKKKMKKISQMIELMK